MSIAPVTPSSPIVQEIHPSLEGLPPLHSYRGMLKIVYSNRPDLVKSRPWRLFRAGETPEWYPENTLTGQQMPQAARGQLLGDCHIIVTNSLYLLRAYHMARHEHPKAIQFVYIHFSEEPHNIHVCPFSISASNSLEALPVPQLDWEMEQSEAYLDNSHS